MIWPGGYDMTLRLWVRAGIDVALIVCFAYLVGVIVP